MCKRIGEASHPGPMKGKTEKNHSPKRHTPSHLLTTPTPPPLQDGPSLLSFVLSCILSWRRGSGLDREPRSQGPRRDALEGQAPEQWLTAPFTFAPSAHQTVLSQMSPSLQQSCLPLHRTRPRSGLTSRRQLKRTGRLDRSHLQQRHPGLDRPPVPPETCPPTRTRGQTEQHTLFQRVRRMCAVAGRCSRCLQAETANPFHTATIF